MSRIGKKPVSLPEGVGFHLAKDTNTVTIKGPKGELSQTIGADFVLEQKERELHILRPTEQKRHKSLHGLYRSLLNNMVAGVSIGYKIDLELVGVGYKVSAQGNTLELSLGYSHAIFMGIPGELKVSTQTLKGKNPVITLEGIDKQLIGQVAAKIRSLRKPEPYKGKGIRFLGEEIRRKTGKQAAK